MRFSRLSALLSAGARPRTGIVLAAVCASLSVGCSDLGVGRKCLTSGVVQGTQIASPALECMSKLCLLQAAPQPTDKPRSTCTARCNSDADCAGANLGNASDGLCGSKFVCAVATTVDLDTKATEHFACQTICICKDDLNAGGFTNASSDKSQACCPTACSNAGACPSNLPKDCSKTQ